jgi:hypothetical protein
LTFATIARFPPAGAERERSSVPRWLYSHRSRSFVENDAVLER